MTRTTTDWKLNRLHVFFASLLALFIISYACRKTDQLIEKPTKEPDEYRFFAAHYPTDHRVVAALEFLKRKNKDMDFVKTTITQIGYPYWDNAIVVKNTDSNMRGANEDSVTVVFVPFVRDSQTVVNASMQIVMNGSDTAWDYVCDWQYQDTVDGMNGKQQSLLLMSLDRNVFGERIYRILDSNAYGGGVSHVKISSATVASKNQSTGRGTSYYAWVTITVCGMQWVPVDEGQVEGCEPGPNCELYTEEEVCNEVLFWAYFEGGGSSGTTGSGGSSGSGGGGSNGTPLECVPDLARGMTEQLNCEPGWIPGYSSSGSGLIGAYNFNVWTVTGDDQLKIDYWKQNNIDTTGLDSCMRKIIEKIIHSSSSNYLAKLLTKMDKAVFEPTGIKKFNIKFTTSIFDTTQVAKNYNSNFNSSTGEFTTEITINEYWIPKATELYWNSTIIHEVIHAYLRNIHYRYHYTLDSTQINSMGLSGLFDSFIDTLMTRNSQEGLNNLFSGDPQYDHNYMAKYLINAMADATEQADGSSMSNKRYYWHLAWGGLHETKTWKQHWPNYPTWPPTSGYPSPSEDSLRGLKYALTQSRLDSIWTISDNEQRGKPGALGKPKIVGGCY